MPTQLFEKSVSKIIYLDDYDKECQMTVNYGFDVAFANKHNQAPHFAITADVYQWRRGRRSREVSFGMQHDLIAKHFPELEPLLQWHLVSWPGTPMHYIANGIYWFEKVLGVSRWKRESYEPDPLEAFKNTVNFGEVIGDETELQKLLDEYGNINPESPEVQKAICAEVKPKVEAWLNKRADAVAHRFQRAMIEFGLAILED